MAEETNQETIVPLNTTQTYTSRRKRLLIIIGVILGLIIISIIVIPTSIILTRKTDTKTTTSIPETTEIVTITTTTTITTATEITATTTTTTITTETTTTTTLATIPPDAGIFKLTTERVVGIWDTIAGGDSKNSPPGSNTDKTVGTYWFTEPPLGALDGTLTREYTNYGTCLTASVNSIECGLNTGFYLTLAVKKFTLVAFQMATYKQSIERDPLMITIEGSNYDGVVLTSGMSWNLIYNGTTGLTNDPGRRNFGMLTLVASPVPIPFSSYRILVTSKRGIGQAVSYSEFRMIGY